MQSNNYSDLFEILKKKKKKKEEREPLIDEGGGRDGGGKWGGLGGGGRGEVGLSLSLPKPLRRCIAGLSIESTKKEKTED